MENLTSSSYNIDSLVGIFSVEKSEGNRAVDLDHFLLKIKGSLSTMRDIPFSLSYPLFSPFSHSPSLL